MTNNINTEAPNTSNQNPAQSSENSLSPTDQKLNDLTFEFFSNQNPTRTEFRKEMKVFERKASKEIYPSQWSHEWITFHLNPLSHYSAAIKSIENDESHERETIQQSLTKEYKKLQDDLETLKNIAKAKDGKLSFNMVLGGVDYGQKEKKSADTDIISKSNNTESSTNTVSRPFDYSLEDED